MIYAVNKRTKEHVAPATPSEQLWFEMGEGWETIQADADGWIEWQGGECPLPGDCFVQIKTNIGIPNEGRSDEFRWARQSRHGDIIGYRPIIAYRPVLDADTRPEPPFSRDLGINALAERPLWDGESWPPSEGARVEVREANDDSFMFATVRAIGMLKERTRIAVTTDCGKLLTYHGTHGKNGLMVRPIRSEEDCFVDAVNEVMEKEGLYSLERHARALYRAGLRFPKEGP